MTGVARTSLSVLAPLRAGSGESLLAALGSLDAAGSPFAQVAGTHFGRWVHVPALTGPGGGRLDSEGAFLLMGAEFDQTLPEWTQALCTSAGAALDRVMCHCDGFPGSADSEAVLRYFAAHDTRPGFTIAGYRRARVEEVQAALRTRRQLRELAIRTQAGRLDPAALRRAWQAATAR